jgi:hypothetical protein
MRKYKRRSFEEEYYELPLDKRGVYLGSKMAGIGGMLLGIAAIIPCIRALFSQGV